MAFTTPAYLALSRHGIFYFRMTIPTALRPAFGARELKRSLKTPHRQTAIRLARAYASHCEALFETLREHRMTYREMRGMLQDAKAQLLGQLKALLVEQGPPAMKVRRNLVNEREALRTCSGFDMWSPNAREMADRVLATNNITLPPDSDDYHRFCVETTKMLDALWRSYLEHSEALDDYGTQPKPVPAPSHPVPVPVPVPAPTTPTPPAAPGVCVRQLIEAYCAEKQREGSWTDKTEQEHRAVFNLFSRVTGDVPVETITFETARNYKAVLLKLPANLNKDPLYRDKSIEQVLAMKPAKTMAVNTINKNLTRVSALFAWARKHGYVSENYFNGLTLKNNKRAHEERAAFTDEELAKLFGTPQYRQHKFLHPHYYWLPLLGLHTGARLEELCQLHLDDIQDVSGIWVFNINDEAEKKLKTPASQRLIPIHSTLIELGLLRYVDTLRKRAETRLFPKLKHGRDGYSQAASRWFSRYREPLGLHNQMPRRDFHSFRHTLANELKQQGVAEAQVAALIGHSKGGITFERYGKPYLPTLLADVMTRLDYSAVLENVKSF